ncbi:MAG: hypothetical protein LBC70_07925 [Chitinispirillales bacterium]|jgi:hypothetical protein|nr:hypothetical protein [Chitinispirillales bacterium]
MNDRGLMLKELMRALTEAAAHANNTLRRDYTAQIRERERGDFIHTPQPLCVAGMRVAFTASVKDDEHSGFRENGGDIRLDFNSPQGNFKGEILFSPYTPNLDASYEYDDGGDVAESGSEEKTYANAPAEAYDEVPPGESFECSGIY